MRYSPVILSIAMVIAGLSLADAAAGQDTSATPSAAASETPAASRQVVWTASKSLQVSILREITARRAKSRDETSTRMLDVLGTLYSAELTGPLWIGDRKLSERAHKALAELRRADEWGLTPADYAVRVPRNLGVEADEARFEIDFTQNLLKYVDHAQNGRFRPSEMSLWYERTDKKIDYFSIIRQLAEAQDPSTVLVAQHPQHEGFKRLREVYLRRMFPERSHAAGERSKLEPRPVVLAMGVSVRLGQRDPQIPLLRRRLEVPAASLEVADLYDRELMEAVNAFMRTQGWRRKHVFDNKVRAALNEMNGAARAQTNRVSTQDILANMEKWRWLPRDLGSIYVWNNLPSFKTQVVKNGRVIHEERIIIGKTGTQTPVFSDTMTHVIFKPQWGVPSSIKVQSLLPRLAAGDYDVLRRRGMRIQFPDKVVSPMAYDWSRTDITSIPIVMGAGSSNPLGRIKFMFPNHHAVYMHDTPDKHLFENSERLFSHGCIRVRNPLRLAEVVLGETLNWSLAQIDAQLTPDAQESHRIDLNKTLSVHNTYFTVMADEAGNLETLPDIYDYDRRIEQALAGVSLSVIARSDPARLQKQEIERLAKATPQYAYTAYEQAPVGFFGFFQPQPYTLGGPSGYSYQQPKKYKKTKKKPWHTWSINPFASGY